MQVKAPHGDIDEKRLKNTDFSLHYYYGKP